MRERQSQYAATPPNRRGESGRQPQVLARAPSTSPPSWPRRLAGARPARVPWGPCPPFPQSGFFLWRRARRRGLRCPNHGIAAGSKTLYRTALTPSMSYLARRSICSAPRNLLFPTWAASLGPPAPIWYLNCRSFWSRTSRRRCPCRSWRPSARGSSPSVTSTRSSACSMAGPRAREPARVVKQTSSSRVLTVPATVARSYTCGSTTS